MKAFKTVEKIKHFLGQNANVYHLFRLEKLDSHGNGYVMLEYLSVTNRYVYNYGDYVYGEYISWGHRFLSVGEVDMYFNDLVDKGLYSVR